MWVWLRTIAFLAVTLWLLPAAPAARADDLLVMPYACTVADGRPILRRSREDEGHRVFGRREQRTFQACSPINPDICRQWTVYRFDLDCGGVRVPWVSVVAAAARHDGVWVEEGRLRLDMGPRWGLSPDDPCAGISPSDDRWRNRRLNRYCADRRALAGPSVVDMPPGFAPMLGIDGIFVAGGAAPGGATTPPWAVSPIPGASPPAAKGAGADGAQPPPEPAPKVARTEPPRPPAPEPAPDFATKVTRAEPSRPSAPEPPASSARVESPAASPAAPPPVLPELAAKGARVASLPPAPQQPAKGAAGQEAAPRARPEPPPETKRAEAKPAPSPPPPSPAPEAGPGTPLKPRIINRPAAPPAEVSPPQPPPSAPAPKSAAAPEAAGPSPKVAALPALPPPLQPKEAVAPDRPAEPAAARKEEGNAPLTLMSAIRGPAMGAASAVALLALLWLTALVLLRRRERVRTAGAPRRDLGAVSLDGRTGGPPPPGVPRASGLEAQPPRLEPAPAEPPAMPSNWGDRIPSTREEALQVLGVGVTPDASLAAIKKIVDGLRASWHPDLAAGGPDRQLRELRMKQINAAWEIIAGKRAAV